MNRRWLFWLIVGGGMLALLYALRSMLLPFVLGAMVAYFLDPAADRLQKLRFSRLNATIIITVIFFLSILLLSILLIPQVTQQLGALLQAVPGYLHQFEQEYAPKISQWLGGLPLGEFADMQSAAKEASAFLLTLGTGFISGLFQSGMAIVHLLSLILITPVVTFYLLRDWDKLTHRLDQLLPRPHVVVIREQLALIDRTLSGFIRGQMNVCLFVAVYYAIGLSIAGVNFAIILGLITGLLVIIPYIGTIFSAVLALTVTFFQFGSLDMVLVVGAIFASGQVIEGTFVTPKLVGDKVGLHPLWIIFGMLAGGTLFGFVGVLLAVPVTAVIGVLIRFAITEYLGSSYYRGDSKAAAKR